MIAPDTIARIKERTDIVALIGESVKLTRRGRSFTGLCPFHKEKSPSFHVHADRGFYHCFGCQESGSAIDFVMKTNGLDFIEAVRMLGDRAGIIVEETESSPDRRAAKSEKDELYAVNALAASFFETCLGLATEAAKGKPHPLARYAKAELEKRGMPDLSEAKGGDDPASRWVAALFAFRIGYAPPGWDGLASHLRKQGLSPMVGERAGLLVAGTRGHYDRFRHRLMFAVLDPLGRIVAFSGRALAPPSRDELARFEPHAPSYEGAEEPAKYINSPESPVYKKGEHLFGLFQAKRGLRARQEALLVEGNFDVVSLHARGIDHAVAPLGTAFTTDQAKLLKRFVPQVVVVFDGDAAGKKATRAARVPCREGGLEARVASLPLGLDPDNLVRKEGPAALLARVKDARGMLEHLIAEALDGDRFGGTAITERVARVRAVTKLLSEEPDPNLRLMAKRYADQLSSKLIVGNAAPAELLELERLVSAAVNTNPANDRGEPARRPHLQGEERETTERKMSLAIFGALLDAPELLDDPVARALGALEGDLALAVAALRRKISSDREASPAGRGADRASPTVGPAGGASAPSEATSTGGERGAPRSETFFDVADFLATLPRWIQSFSAGRLACPRFENASEAQLELLENASKLTRALEKRQKPSKMTVLERSASTLDAEQEAALRELQRLARKRQGID